MTDYNAITNATIDADSPITTQLMTYMRDNPIAIAEGSAGAPLIQIGAIDFPVLTPISSQTASSSSSLTFTSGISSSYIEYELWIQYMQLATATALLLLQYSTDGGSSWLTTGYTNVTGLSTAGVELTGGSPGGGSAAMHQTQVRIINPYSGPSIIWARVTGSTYSPVFSYISTTNTGVRSTTAVNAFRLIASSGNIASGTAWLLARNLE